MRLVNIDDCNRSLFYKESGGKDSLITVESVFNMFEALPTAYDIDKVVQELEEKTDFLKNCTKYGNKNAEQQAESYSTMMMYEVADLVDDLIEIVKQGGVAYDVCEWTQSGDMAISPHTFSKYKIKQCDGLYALSTCPYCGKKIKVVE